MRNKQLDHRFIIEIAVFLLLLYGVSFSVYLNGDDFMYGTFAHTGILSSVVDYYFTGNGRFWVNILDSTLLWFDRYAFIVLLPWIVLCFVVLFAKTVLHIMGDFSNQQKEKELIRTGMVLFSCLDVLCLRETVFWITGMMNYLLPAVVFLLAYLLFRKSKNGELHGIGLLGYYVICFFAASSVEQYALMFVGMMTLHFAYELLKKQKIHPKEWLAYCISLAGLALLLLAPGNFQRVEEQQIPDFVVNLWSLLYQDTVHDVAMPYLVMLSLIGTWIAGKATHRIVRIIMWGVPCIILVVLCTPLTNKAAVLAVLILLWILQMAAMLIILREQIKAEYLFLCIVGIGSQATLLVSAVWGFRCMLSLYLVYMLLISCLMYRAPNHVKMIVLSCGIAAAIHPALAVILGAIYVLLRQKRFQNAVSGIARVIAYSGTTLALVILIIGYAGNVQTHDENLLRTKKPVEQTIVLKELPDDTYSWYSVPMNEFHDAYYRQLHHIPESVQITYELR